ncbi:hypothetical protein Btru_006493 [Bulinus truncatus]|nr:hypothetical protein Btru_006493 [Bulinus truncatus]
MMINLDDNTKTVGGELGPGLFASDEMYPMPKKDNNLHESEKIPNILLERSVDIAASDEDREEVLQEKEESLSDKEKLVTAEIEKEEESDEEKKEISPTPLEQAVVEEVKDECFAPVVKQELMSVTTKDGGQARFEAEIVGLPTPTITWYKDEEVIQPSEEFEIAYSENVAYLFIMDVLPEDAGKYVIVAKNELGTATTTANLEVEAAEVSGEVSPEDTSALAPIFTIKPQFQLVDEEETAVFNATIQAVPQPKVRSLGDKYVNGVFGFSISQIVNTVS